MVIVMVMMMVIKIMVMRRLGVSEVLLIGSSSTVTVPILRVSPPETDPGCPCSIIRV
jgi:hypothetical protein